MIETPNVRSRGASGSGARDNAIDDHRLIGPANGKGCCDHGDQHQKRMHGWKLADQNDGKEGAQDHEFSVCDVHYAHHAEHQRKPDARATRTARRARRR